MVHFWAFFAILRGSGPDFLGRCGLGAHGDCAAMTSGPGGWQLDSPVRLRASFILLAVLARKCLRLVS